MPGVGPTAAESRASDILRTGRRYARKVWASAPVVPRLPPPVEVVVHKPRPCRSTCVVRVHSGIVFGGIP
ncbi:hypothetical protein FAIPA1_20233 [Frankia sp. AiPs1]